MKYKNTENPVEDAIIRLLNEYIDNPLLYLREANQQCRLQNLISENLSANNKLHCQTEIFSNSKDGKLVGAGLTCRVQEELKVGSGKRDVSDIVVLREAGSKSPVKLLREKYGALDIIAKIRNEDVDAVIEIKAACSADPEQRHLFRKDVVKLLGIAKADDETSICRKLSLHFVLIDKSLAVGAVDILLNKDQKQTWWKGAPQTCRGEESPQLRVVDDVSPETPFVHVWTIEPDNDGKVTWKLRYCTN
jgi:hypothetical protein